MILYFRGGQTLSKAIFYAKIALFTLFSIIIIVKNTKLRIYSQNL